MASNASLTVVYEVGPTVPAVAVTETCAKLAVANAVSPASKRKNVFIQKNTRLDWRVKGVLDVRVLVSVFMGFLRSGNRDRVRRTPQRKSKPMNLSVPRLLVEMSEWRNRGHGSTCSIGGIFPKIPYFIGSGFSRRVRYNHHTLRSEKRKSHFPR
jgi:hypothetical protein